MAAATKIINFTVHGIGTAIRDLEPGEGAVWISPAQFEEVLAAVAARPGVRLTFDDANESDVEIALPRLIALGLRAQFFLPAGLLGQPGRLSEQGVRELAGAGMTIGSHGWSHRDWRRLRPADARVELEQSVRRLEELSGAAVTAASIPFGSYDRRVLGRLREAGFARVYSSDGGPADPQGWFQARTSLHSDLDPAWLNHTLDGTPPLALRARRVAARTVKRLR